MGFEIVPGETIPAATGVVPVAVNFTKGCYPGQELVERMDSRGADAPKQLRIVEVVRLPRPATRSSSTERGRCDHQRVPGRGIALAMVKRGADVGARSPREPEMPLLLRSAQVA